MITFSGWTLKPPSVLSRLIVLMAISGAMMLMDHRGQQLERIRSGLNLVIYPIQLIAAFPLRVGSGVWEFFRGKTNLQDNYARAVEENRALGAKLLRFNALEAENEHLRGLLAASRRIADRATVADILELSPEPFTRKLVLAKGKGDSVYVGQPVIDAYGIVGQITDVGAVTSTVTLITDPSHAIPVQVVRNGLRAIVFGNGAQDYAEVPHLTAVADIKEGDELVTSGMGGVFPAGYPVARVLRVVSNPNESFLKITVRPSARLDHNREVMLIWPNLPKPTAPPTAAKAR